MTLLDKVLAVLFLAAAFGAFGWYLLADPDSRRPQ